MLSRSIDAALVAAGKGPCLSAADGVVVSGHDLHAAAGRKAAVLLSLGVAPGDRILTVSTKSAEMLSLYLAALRTGAVFTPIEHDVRHEQVLGAIDDAQPAVLVAPQATLARSAQKLRMSRVRTALSMEADGSGTLRDLCLAQQPARTSVLVRPTDLALLVYGRSEPQRAVMFSHAALARQAEVAGALLALGGADLFVHALSRWAEPASLAFLAAALVARARVGLTTDADAIGPASFADAAMLVTDTWPVAAQEDVRSIYVSLHAGPAPGATNYLSLPEAGLVALAGGDGRLQVLPGLDARVEAGALAISDTGLFSGYWRRAQESKQALKPGGDYLSTLPAEQADDGRIVLTPQP